MYSGVPASLPLYFGEQISVIQPAISSLLTEWKYLSKSCSSVCWAGAWLAKADISEMTKTRMRVRMMTTVKG